MLFMGNHIKVYYDENFSVLRAFLQLLYNLFDLFSAVYCVLPQQTFMYHLIASGAVVHTSFWKIFIKGTSYIWNKICFPFSGCWIIFHIYDVKHENYKMSYEWYAYIYSAFLLTSGPLCDGNVWKRAKQNNVISLINITHNSQCQFSQSVA